MDIVQSPDVKHLTPNTPETVVPGSVIRISYRFTPEVCRAMRQSIDLTFVTQPQPFVPDPKPGPYTPTPGQYPGMPPEEINERMTDAYQRQEQSEQSQWASSHLVRQFTVPATVFPGEHEGEGFIEGIVQPPHSNPAPQYGQYAQYGPDTTLYAGTYHLTPPNFFDQQPGQPGPGVIVQLSAEAQSELTSYTLVVEHDFSAPPPPPLPPPQVIEVTELKIDADRD